MMLRGISQKNSPEVMLTSIEMSTSMSTGQKTAHSMYDSDGAFIMTIIMRPNREKNLVTIQVGTAVGELQTKQISAVDSRGRDIETVRFDGHGEILSQTQWSYDDHGKPVERISSGREGDIREFKSYEYDERGNWTKKTTRKSNHLRKKGRLPVELLNIILIE